MEHYMELFVNHIRVHLDRGPSEYSRPEGQQVDRAL